MIPNNFQVKMTRRYPELSRKKQLHDSKIAMKLMNAWDVEKDKEKVLSIFLAKKHLLSHERYWETLRSVWIISGCVENVKTFRMLFSVTRPKKYYFSTPEDEQKLKDMPDVLEVYRAGSENDGGISWTISREYAEQYKKTFDKEKLFKREINKKDVFAYIQRNLEEEIIILD